MSIHTKERASLSRYGVTISRNIIVLLFITLFSLSAYAGPKAADCPNGVFDNGNMYDANKNFTSNTCSNEGTVCSNTYFYGKTAYKDAICSGGHWVVAGPIPVEPDGGIGDGAGPIPVEPDGGIGDGAGPIPVEPDGGIGDGAGPIPEDPDGPKDDGNGNCGNGKGQGNAKGCDNGNDGGAVEGCPNGVFDDGKMYDAHSNYVDNSCRNQGQSCANTYFYGLPGYDTAVCDGEQWINEPAEIFCGGIAGFQCPTGLTCVDDPRDTCDPANGGADCIGLCQDLPPKPECNFDTDPKVKTYVGETPEICTRILFVCDAGFEYFSDECGCGCKKIEDTSGEVCGRNTCSDGMVCCNASCGICTEPDGFCTQQACAP